MRASLTFLPMLLLSACGQSGNDTGAAAGDGGNAATITEGTISDDMIDLSESESYGATSTVVDSPDPARSPNANASNTARNSETPKSQTRTRDEESDREEASPSTPEPEAEPRSDDSAAD